MIDEFISLLRNKMLRCAIVKVYFPKKGYGFLIDGGYENNTSRHNQTGDIFFDVRAIKYSLIDKTRRFPKIITNYHECYSKANNPDAKRVNLFQVKKGMLVAYQPCNNKPNKAFSIVHENTYLLTCKTYYSTYPIPLNKCEGIFDWWVYKQLLKKLEPEVEFQFKLIQNNLQLQFKATTDKTELHQLQIITQKAFQALCLTSRGVKDGYNCLQIAQEEINTIISSQILFLLQV
jgi:cold shock CspA family protein